MPSLKDFIDALQAGWFPALAAFIGCSIVIAGDYYSIPYLANAPYWLTTIAAYVGVFSISILLANLAYFPVRFWKRYQFEQSKAEFIASIVEEIVSAPHEEQSILAYIVTSGKKVFLAKYDDSRLAPLVAKGILQKLEGTHNVLEWPYRVQDDAWNYLLDQKEYFHFPKINEIEDPFNWRNRSY